MTKFIVLLILVLILAVMIAYIYSEWVDMKEKKRLDKYFKEKYGGFNQ